MSDSLRINSINELITVFEEAAKKKKLRRKDKRRINTHIAVFQTFEPIYAWYASSTSEEEKLYDERAKVLLELGKKIGVVK